MYSRASFATFEFGGTAYDTLVGHIRQGDIFNTSFGFKTDAQWQYGGPVLLMAGYYVVFGLVVTPWLLHCRRHSTPRGAIRTPPSPAETKESTFSAEELARLPVDHYDTPGAIAGLAARLAYARRQSMEPVRRARRSVEVLRRASLTGTEGLAEATHSNSPPHLDAAIASSSEAAAVHAMSSSPRLADLSAQSPTSSSSPQAAAAISESGAAVGEPATARRASIDFGSRVRRAADTHRRRSVEVSPAATSPLQVDRALLSFSGVSYDVGGGVLGGTPKRLLHDLSGVVESGQLMALMGASGAGGSVERIPWVLYLKALSVSLLVQARQLSSTSSLIARTRAQSEGKSSSTVTARAVDSLGVSLGSLSS